MKKFVEFDLNLFDEMKIFRLFKQMNKSSLSIDKHPSSDSFNPRRVGQSFVFDQPFMCNHV